MAIAISGWVLITAILGPGLVSTSPARIKRRQHVVDTGEDRVIIDCVNGKFDRNRLERSMKILTGETMVRERDNSRHTGKSKLKVWLCKKLVEETKLERKTKKLDEQSQMCHHRLMSKRCCFFLTNLPMPQLPY